MIRTDPVKMVPNQGLKSNFDAAGSNEKQCLTDTHDSPEFEPLDAETIKELFDTLAYWNDYLEEHVPDLEEVQP